MNTAKVTKPHYTYMKGLLRIVDDRGHTATLSQMADATLYYCLLAIRESPALIPEAKVAAEQDLLTTYYCHWED